MSCGGMYLCLNYRVWAWSLPAKWKHLEPHPSTVCWGFSLKPSLPSCWLVNKQFPSHRRLASVQLRKSPANLYLQVRTRHSLFFFPDFSFIIFDRAGSLLLRLGFSLVVARGGRSLVVEHGLHCSAFSRCGAQALGRTGFSSCSSPVLGHWLNSCVTHGLSCSMACGIFPTGDPTCVSFTGTWILYP